MGGNWLLGVGLFIFVIFNGFRFTFQQLRKSTTSILNKITPEKFQKLIESMKGLPIDTESRLQVVVDLIYEKVRITVVIIIELISVHYYAYLRSTSEKRWYFINGFTHFNEKHSEYSDQGCCQGLDVGRSLLPSGAEKSW